MAGYLACLTWMFLLALCCTPTLAHSGNHGLVGEGGNRQTRAATTAGGNYPDRPGAGVIIRTRPGNRRRIPPVIKGISFFSSRNHTFA
ncbi:hypothetical protein Hamer_G014907 [Homarus americanus]|uniref:Secreted protein n=1 Tax=Homarus americanus TaxID=6706 RepID=A0A8J5JLT8_HOMAM|nr:hypothetical protein Hamer_G014907 [Homarus americanus]